MKKKFQTLFKFCFNFFPREIINLIISYKKSMTYYLNDNRNVVVQINNQFFGKIQFNANTSFKIDKEILYKHYYDLKLLKYLQRLVKKGDYCFDIGANVGAITLSLSHLVGETGKVFSFEPGIELFERLQRNVLLNKMEQVSCYNFGLSNKVGKMFWSYDTENPGNAFLAETGSIEVSIKILDEIEEIKDLKRVDLIKIDVEGMELEVLMGSYNLLNKFKPAIIYETSVGQYFKKIKELQIFLSRIGYKFYEIDVPERFLTLNGTAFNFIPTAFPHLPQNTLAIHESKTHGLN